MSGLLAGVDGGREGAWVVVTAPRRSRRPRRFRPQPRHRGLEVLGHEGAELEASGATGPSGRGHDDPSALPS
ncbi:MAG: hypothetical protein AAFZ18_01435, partial [Myxococcota bacterium]